MKEDTASKPFSGIRRTTPTFYIVGMTTGKSSIMMVFPHWVGALGRPEIVIDGIDHLLHDSAEAYRETVAQMKYDDLSLGGLVTAHKIDVWQSAGDMFDPLRPDATITAEVSCISKRPAGRGCPRPSDCRIWPGCRPRRELLWEDRWSYVVFRRRRLRHGDHLSSDAHT